MPDSAEDYRNYEGRRKLGEVVRGVVYSVAVLGAGLVGYGLGGVEGVVIGAGTATVGSAAIEAGVRALGPLFGGREPQPQKHITQDGKKI